MDLIVRKSGGANVVLRPQARPRYYAPATAAPQRVEVWWRYADESNSAARLVGEFAPGARVRFPFTPDEDRNVVLLTRARSADGAPDVSSLDDAVQATVLFARETAAPSVAQVGASTQTNITLAIDGFTRFARSRRLRVADNGLMTGATTVVSDGGGRELPRLVDIRRDATQTQAQTVYVRVSHSSGQNVYGAESPAQAFSFADSAGAGGSSGEGDDLYRERHDY